MHVQRAGTVYTMLFIFLRLFDGSYAAGGKFHALIPVASQPSFYAPTAARPLFNPGMFVLLWAAWGYKYLVWEG